MSFFNWSLEKLLSTEPDNFNKARIKILFMMIIFAIVKLVITIPVGYYNGQDFQLGRSLLLIVIFLVLLKAMLIKRTYTPIIGVILIWMGLFLIWTNTFIVIQNLNIVTVQVIVMIILSSFYLLTWRWGIVYSVLAVLPVFILLVAGERLKLANLHPTEMASPAFELLVVLNFVNIVLAHYLYYRGFRDNILEKEALNKKLQEAVKEANLAVQSKADFLSTMSHELRTPLNSVIGMTQLLLNSPYTQEQSENLKIVNFSAMNLHMLINDILDFNKIESDKLTLESIKIDFAKLIKDISSGMRFQAEEKGLELIVTIDDSIKNYQIITDPTRLTQIIHNLLGNAIKFTHSGKVFLDIKITERSSGKVSIKFSVRDTGIGISPEQQEVIFEAFTQASSSTTRNFGGTGLGLTIVKRLLGLFGSDISVKSRVGEGAEFVFEILFDAANQVDITDASDTIPDHDLSAMKVLVVEDNPINSLLLKKVFSNWNNQPVFAQNGHEAIDKVEESVYDVILMDIHMPLLDGYETTRVIRRMPDIQRSCIPIIALTASVSNDLYSKIKEAGMNDYINKPFNSDDLYAKLKRIKFGNAGTLLDIEKIVS